MSVNGKLTSLADGFRKKYMLTDKLSISEMTGLIEGFQTVLPLNIPSDVYRESMIVTQDGLYTTLKANADYSRIVLKCTKSPKGHLVGAYIVASCDQPSGVTINVGPMGGITPSVKVNDSSMRGYLVTFEYTLANAFSIMISGQEGATVNIKEVRMWIID